MEDQPGAGGGAAGGGRADSAWVRRPASTDAAEIDLKVPDGSLLPALEKLMALLQQKEQGVGGAVGQAICNVKGSCQPIVDGECAWHVSCRIV
jgi:hypothetical protein